MIKPKRKKVNPSSEKMAVLKQEKETAMRQLLKSKGKELRPGYELVKREGSRCYGRCQHASHARRGQCNGRVKPGELYCPRHAGRIRKVQEYNAIPVAQGLYRGARIAVLKKALAEVEELPKESLDHLEDEIKFHIAMLREMLAATNDAELLSDPGAVLSVMKRIAELKKDHWEMRYSPNVSFTREQVEFLFAKIKMVLVTVIKDAEVLQKIATEIQAIGASIKTNGWQ